MNGDAKKKIVPSEYIGKHEKRRPAPINSELDEKIRDFKSDLRLLGDDVIYECFMEIIELMFYCMYHHMYNSLYNALKEAHKKF